MENKIEAKKIGFIGAGQMGEAIFSGAIKNGISPSNIFITDVSFERLEHLKEKYDINALTNDASYYGACQVIKNCDVVIFAVKPQFGRELLANVKEAFTSDKLAISIMGGITLAFLEEHLPNIPVLRVMPNTPMLVCKGIAGIAAGKYATAELSALGVELFNKVGMAYLLPEGLIDPLTSVSGCSPAFVYMFIEALADGGVEKGLPRNMAIKLAAQAVSGAAEMVLQTNTHPGVLKDNVCSPGGGTIAGVHALERGSFRGTVMNAVEASCERMIEVGKKA